MLLDLNSQSQLNIEDHKTLSLLQHDKSTEMRKDEVVFPNDKEFVP